MGDNWQSQLEQLLENTKSGQYIGIHAYLPISLENHQNLQDIRKWILERYRIPTTLGYGPRFLHSTGQLHKGGKNNGRFIRIISQSANDIQVPGETFTFDQFTKAQFVADGISLKKRERFLKDYLLNRITMS